MVRTSGLTLNRPAVDPLNRELSGSGSCTRGSPEATPTPDVGRLGVKRDQRDPGRLKAPVGVAPPSVGLVAAGRWSLAAVSLAVRS